MPDPQAIFGTGMPQAYTNIIALALIAAGAWLLLRAQPSERKATADVLLAVLIVGVIGARLVHVALNWAHFSYNLDEIARLSAGGLDWRGAVVGGLAGGILAAQWRALDWRPLLDTAALPLALVAAMGWLGCWAASCAYVAEVASLADYPPLVAWEGRDVYGIYAPRYNTQLIGLLLSLMLLGLGLLAIRRGWLAGRRFWLMLAAISLMMLSIGFLRGDYALDVAGLRLGQWLDLLLMITAGGLALRGTSLAEHSL